MEPVIKRIVSNNKNNDESDTKDDEKNTKDSNISLNVNDDHTNNKNINLTQNAVSKKEIDVKKISSSPAIITKNTFLFENKNKNENENKNKNENENENENQNENNDESRNDKKIKKYLSKFSFLQYLPLEIEIVGKPLLL